MGIVGTRQCGDYEFLGGQLISLRLARHPAARRLADARHSHRLRGYGGWSGADANDTPLIGCSSRIVASNFAASPAYQMMAFDGPVQPSVGDQLTVAINGVPVQRHGLWIPKHCRNMDRGDGSCDSDNARVDHGRDDVGPIAAECAAFGL